MSKKDNQNLIPLPRVCVCVFIQKLKKKKIVSLFLAETVVFIWRRFLYLYLLIVWPLSSILTVKNKDCSHLKHPLSE